MPTKFFIWDELSDNVLFETDENNNVLVAYTHRPEKFGEVLYHKVGPRYTYYHYDGNGSTNKLTGDTATVTKNYIFTGFGELVASPGLGSTPFAYKGAAGYYSNSVTNDIYVRARTYEPTTGRWLSKDPLGFIDGPNLYGAYFAPTFIDPSGNLRFEPSPSDFDPCGGVKHVGKWRIDDGEQRGVILQKVCFELEVNPCNRKDSKPVDCTKSWDCPNSTQCNPDDSGKTCYLEIWWVGTGRRGGVIAPSKDKPDRSGPTDTFFNTNCRNSWGRFKQDGGAVFLSEEFLRDNGLLDIIENDFRGPPNGVKNACHLWSACFEDEKPKSVWSKVLEKKLLVLHRVVETIWDCCNDNDTVGCRYADPTPTN